MPEESPQQTRLEAVVDVLQRHGVEFVVIGGQAQVLHGGLRPTVDVDVCYGRSRANLERLASALREIAPTLRGAPPDLPVRLDARTLEMGLNFTLSTRIGDLDLLGEVEPIGAYEQVLASAETYELPVGRVQAISLDDLIRVKEHIKRAKDAGSVEELRALKSERERLRASGGDAK
ncbi:MAG: hypothetical protein R3B68_01170 [Phycisphaerales bacterium]